jgi:hypothetical protein
LPPTTVTIECDATASAPTPVGGVIQDGVYHLTSSTFYAGGGTCPTPEVDGVSWQVCGTSWQLAQNDSVNGQVQPSLVANATVVAAGSDVTITVTCGLASPPPPFVYGYDANTTTLRLHIGGGTSATTGRVDTFTRE